MSIDISKLDNAMELVRDGAEKGYFPGAVAAVGHRSGLYRTVYFGNRCIYPEVLPLDQDTLFDLASLTKVVATTTLFMIFMERGMISAYDKVSDHVPGFTEGYKKDVTLFNLLTHTAGLVSHIPFYKICGSYEEAVKLITSTELEYIPGEKVAYSDLGFILLGYILESAGGDRLDKLCSKYIFEPLDMTCTCFNPRTTNVAATELDSATGMPFAGVCHDENGRFFNGISGHAGLFSNIDDLSKFANMLINEGKSGNTRLLSPSTFKAMVRNYTAGLNEDRSYGWCIKGIKGNRLSALAASGGDLVSPDAFGHTGFTGTSIWVDISNDIYIILLTNRVHPTRDNNSILRFRRLFHNAVLASIC